MKKRNVLIPIGESEESRHILSHIPQFFPPEGAELVFLQVTEKPEVPSDAGISEAGFPIDSKMPPAISYPRNKPRPPLSAEEEKTGFIEQTEDVEPVVYESQAKERRQNEVKDALEEIAVPLREDGYEISTVVQFGEPAKEILKYAETDDEEIDLIAMTTHGRSGVDRFLKGSVAEDILRNSHVPLLLVRPPAAD